MAFKIRRLKLLWVVAASYTPGGRSAQHPLCRTLEHHDTQPILHVKDAHGADAGQFKRDQRQPFLDQEEGLKHGEWISCKDYFGISSDRIETTDLVGSSLHRVLEQSLRFDPEVEGLARRSGSRTEPTSIGTSFGRMTALPTGNARGLASSAGANEHDGINLGQEADRTRNSLVYAPGAKCDEFWLLWPGIQERAIADGTVLVFDLFSSVGNLFLALDYAMKIARMLEVGLILTWSDFPGFREAFDPAEINWTVDAAPFMQPTTDGTAGANTVGRHSMVFENYALVLSDSQMNLLASKLGIVNSDTEALAVHFKSTFPGRFQYFIGQLMREPVWLDEALRTTPCVWNMLLSRSRSMMASMEEHSPWEVIGDDSGRRTNHTEYIAWHIRTREGETALSYHPTIHPYVIQEPAAVVCPTYLVAMEEAMQTVLDCPISYTWGTDVLPVYISSNSKRMAKECTLEAADHDMFMGHVDLGLDESDAHTGYSKDPQKTAVSAFLDFLFLMDSMVIVRTDSSFSGTVASIKGLRCHAKTYDSLPQRPIALCVPSEC